MKNRFIVKSEINNGKILTYNDKILLPNFTPYPRLWFLNSFFYRKRLKISTFFCFNALKRTVLVKLNKFILNFFIKSAILTVFKSVRFLKNLPRTIQSAQKWTISGDYDTILWLIGKIKSKRCCFWNDIRIALNFLFLKQQLICK